MHLSKSYLLYQFNTMIRSILILIVIVIVSLSQSGFAACDPTDTGQSATDFLVGCSTDSSNAVITSGWYWKESVRDLVIIIAERIIQFGALFAIGAIVFAGMRYTTSSWDDERIKWAKNTLIYAVIWLFLLLVAFPFVDVIIWFVYGLGN